MGVVLNGVWKVISMKIHLYENLIADVILHIDHEIAVRIDSIFQVLGDTDLDFRKKFLSEQDLVKTTLSILRDQVGMAVETHEISLLR